MKDADSVSSHHAKPCGHMRREIELTALVFGRTALRLKISLWIIFHILPDIDYILSM